MELLEMVTIFVVLGVVSGTVLVVIKRLIPQKTAKKSADLELKRTIEANSLLTQEMEQRQKALTKSKDQEIQRLRRELNPIDEDGSPIKEVVPFETIMAGAQQMGIPSAVLLPFKKDIMKYTKGMSIEEISQLATQFSGLLGGKGLGQNQEKKSEYQELI